jgi:hypothetical protein
VFGSELWSLPLWLIERLGSEMWYLRPGALQGLYIERIERLQRPIGVNHPEFSQLGS